MRKNRWISLGIALCLLLMWIPQAGAVYEGEQVIELNAWSSGSGWEHSASLNQNAVEEFPDYVWCADPSADHEAVANAPAEYYTGMKPDTTDAVYISHDIIYYPTLPVDGFQPLQYDDDREWCYFYPETSMYHEYIFATLPMEGGAVPERMMHTRQEAYENAVLHIQKPGTYRLKGNWHGQVLVDLGSKDATFSNPEAAVRLILDNINVQCTVAPALIFQNVYECDNEWEDRTEYSSTVSADNAGAVILIADGSTNNFTGENVYRMLRTSYKSDDSQNAWSAVKVQKKQRKIDGAVYSFVTMRIDGEEQNSGVLNIHGGFEGLDSELHLTVNGGSINIFSQDDGINVNEDGVSVLTINGGRVHILAGIGMEGDGIDSNGYLVMNGGTLITMANPRSDSGMDSDRGTFINGGTVVALGSTMDWAESSETTPPAGSQAAMNLQFAAAQSADEAIIVTDEQEHIVFAYDPEKDEVTGKNARWYQGAIISSPSIRVGSAYHVYVGGDVMGVNQSIVYNTDPVTGFTDAAKQQCYSAIGNFGRPGGPPPDFDPNNPPPPPPGGPPPDFDPNNPPPPPPGGPGGMNVLTNKNGDRRFVMSDAVNGFQAVTDYAGTHFEDVEESSRFHDAIMWAAGTGIAEGATETIFAPDTPCTRGQTMLYLWRAAGSPQGGGMMGPGMGGQQPPADGQQPPAGQVSNPFTDVPEDSPYYHAVLWAVQSGITNGMTATTFEPNTIVTRAQSQTFFYRWCHEPETNAANPFVDVPADGYYYQSVRWSVENKLTTGTSETTFEPTLTLTKAQLLTFLYRFMESGLLQNVMGGPPPV